MQLNALCSSPIIQNNPLSSRYTHHNSYAITFHFVTSHFFTLSHRKLTTRGRGNGKTGTDQTLYAGLTPLSDQSI